MLTFCAVSGLPVSGEHGFLSPVPELIGVAPSGPMPDLLEEQEAALHWMSDEGERKTFQVQCSFVLGSGEELPASSSITHNGQDISLLFPVVAHIPSEHRVVLRLPDSFRSRAYTVLSWWMMCMQRSSRDSVPAYAMQPSLEFFQSELPAETMNTARHAAQLERVVDSVHDAPTRTARQEADTVREAPAPRPTRPLRKVQDAATDEAVIDPFMKPRTVELAPQSGKHTSSLEPIASATYTDSASNAEEDNVRTNTSTSLPDASIQEPALAHLNNIVPSSNTNDPAATREAPAPVVPVDEESIAPQSKHDSVETIVVARGSRSPDMVLPDEPPTAQSYTQVEEVATRVSRRPTMMEEEEENSQSWTEVPGAEIANMDFSSTPTVSRRAEPSSLADIRDSNKDEVVTAVRQLAGNGVSLSPEYTALKAAPVDVQAWQNKQTRWFFEASLEKQRCTVAFQFPHHASRVLEQGGQVDCLLQLHRMPSYPLLVLMLTFQDADGVVSDYVFCPFDIDDPQVLIFMDMLMQDFSLQVCLCNEQYQVYRDLQVQLPLEPNVEYLLEQARNHKDSIDSGLRNVSQAVSLFQRDEFDRMGQMSHNFNHDSFSEIRTPAQARLASGIIAYWSEPEQHDYLVSIKSFPLEYFQTIQKRVLAACVDSGIFVPLHLMRKATEFGLGNSVPELLRRMLANFAEVNLNLRQANDLDPWDNVENWQNLFDLCDQFDVAIDDDIEELAIKAQRFFEASTDNINQVEGEEFEIVEDFQDMDPRDLIEMLQEPSHRYESALALCDIADPAYVDHAASVFTELNTREDAIEFADAFTQFGPEAEPLLVSWLHLPRKEHREAAMLALGTMRASSALDAILKRLRSGEEWETAAEALGRMGEAAVPALGQELQNKNWLIRLRAVKALHKIKTGQAIALIEPLLHDPNEVVKAEVAAVLGV